jgi:hypothetical protein
MVLSSADSDAERVGDFFVCLALGDQLQDLALPCSEALPAWMHESGKKNLGDPRGEKWFVVRERPDRVHEKLLCFRFADEGLYACFESAADDVFGKVRAEDRDFGIGQIALDKRRRVQAVQFRHGHVEDHDVGPKCHSLSDGFTASRRFPADFPAGLTREDSSRPFTDQGVVVRAANYWSGARNFCEN